ncbi:hypothetical protein H2203_003807 [Taxawa tesnikishii (nom. ined.)]|nr:hypothetical protein H2203_003807 [Dothideales sp. JES 119]
MEWDMDKPVHEGSPEPLKYDDDDLTAQVVDRPVSPAGTDEIVQSLGKISGGGIAPGIAEEAKGLLTPTESVRTTSSNTLFIKRSRDIASLTPCAFKAGPAITKNADPTASRTVSDSNDGLILKHPRDIPLNPPRDLRSPLRTSIERYFQSLAIADPPEPVASYPVCPGIYTPAKSTATTFPPHLGASVALNEPTYYHAIPTFSVPLLPNDGSPRRGTVRRVQEATSRTHQASLQLRQQHAAMHANSFSYDPSNLIDLTDPAAIPPYPMEPQLTPALIPHPFLPDYSADIMAAEFDSASPATQSVVYNPGSEPMNIFRTVIVTGVLPGTRLSDVVSGISNLTASAHAIKAAIYMHTSLIASMDNRDSAMVVFHRESEARRLVDEVVGGEEWVSEEASKRDERWSASGWKVRLCETPTHPGLGENTREDLGGEG